MNGARIDHVLLGGRTIGPVRDRLRDECGFGITDGSPNPDGTASWIVPMATPLVQYLEILVVHDENTLAADEFGKLFLERTADGPTMLNWAVLVPDIDQAARAVRACSGADPQVLTGESVRADGGSVPWAEAAFNASWAEPERPFFLSYGDMAARKERVAGDLAAAGHTRVPLGIGGLRVCTPDPSALEGWPGPDDIDVEVIARPHRGVEQVTVTTESGDARIRW